MIPISPVLALAAHLADPVWSATSIDSADRVSALLADSARQIGKVLHQNRVSLLPLQRTGSEEMRAILRREPLAEYLANEQLAYTHVRREYASIRTAFANAGIYDVLIKSAGLPPSFPHLSDNVDDLVPPASIAEARRILLDLGYVELRNLEEPHKFFFKRFCEGREVAAHHLHSHIGWAVSFLDESLVLQRARPAGDDPDLLIPHPEDAFLITTAHALYENKAFKLGDLVKVHHCLRFGNLNWQHMQYLAERKGWLDGLNVLIAIFSRLDRSLYGETLFPMSVAQQTEQALSSGQRSYIEALFSRPLIMPLPVGFAFSKRLFYAKCLHDQEQSTSVKIYDMVRHTLNGTKLKLRVHSQPGMLITFSGVDGCGKTRHAQALVNAFEHCDIRASYVWSRSGSSRLTDLLIRIGKAILRRPSTPAGASQEQRANNRRETLRNPWVRGMWIALVTFDLLRQYTLRVRLPLLIGRVVVCDRYTADAITDIASVTGQLPNLVMRLLTVLSPQPSWIASLAPSGVSPSEKTRASFLLSIPSQMAVSRRQEDGLTVASVARQIDIYQTLTHTHDLTVIDNSQPFPTVNDVIVQTVLRSYFDRYRTLINALFMANPSQGNR